MKKQSPLNLFFWVLALAVFVVGLYGIYGRITTGHQQAAYGSLIPWGLWVAGYIFMIGLSAGAFLMSALVYVFRVQQLEKIGPLALLTALATLLGALLMIWQDLGHPLRAWKLLFSTNFTSVMGWMVWLYTAYFILLMTELWFALRVGLVQSARLPGLKGVVCRVLGFGQKSDSGESRTRDLRVLRVLGSIGIPLAIAFHGSVGAIFGTVSARPYWNSGLTPIMFLVGAFVSGGALLAFITALWGPNRGSNEHRSIMQLLGTVVLGLLALDVLLEWAEYSVGLWSPISPEAASVRLILFGPYGWAFWGLHIVGGIVIPGLLLIFGRRSVAAIGVAGLLIAVTFLTVRLNIVLPALAVPEIKGIESAFSGPGLSLNYAPSVMEWLVFLWDVSVSALVLLVGLRILPIIPASGAAPHSPEGAVTEQRKLEVA